MKVYQDGIDFEWLEDNLWGQAQDVLKEISDADMEDELMNLLEMEAEAEDGFMELTNLNDILAFDWEYIYEQLGMPVEE